MTGREIPAHCALEMTRWRFCPLVKRLCLRLNTCFLRGLRPRRAVMPAPTNGNVPASCPHAGRCGHRPLRKTYRRRRVGNAYMRSAPARPQAKPETNEQKNRCHCERSEASRHPEKTFRQEQGARVSGGHLCRRQKRRPSRQARHGLLRR